MGALERQSTKDSKSGSRLLWSVVCAVAVDACIVEESRCGPNQIKISATTSTCDCAPGFVLDAAGNGCEPCGANQKVSGGKCVCENGFEPSDDGAGCERTVGSYPGKTCSQTEPCADPAPWCVTWSDQSYCTTRGCTRNGECPFGWLCESTDGGFCRQPTGLLSDCQEDAQCAGTDATFCERFQSRKCLIEACASDASVCPNGYVCCDLSALIQRSLCVPESSLTGGVCFDGKAPVQP